MRNKTKAVLLLLIIFIIGIVLYIAFLNADSEKEPLPVWSQYITQDKEIDSLLKNNPSLAEIRIDSLYRESIQNKDTLKLAYAYFHKTVINRKKFELDSIPFFWKKHFYLPRNMTTIIWRQNSITKQGYIIQG